MSSMIGYPPNEKLFFLLEMTVRVIFTALRKAQSVITHYTSLL